MNGLNARPERPSFSGKLKGEPEGCHHSIARNLENVFNAKGGYSSVAEGFGLGRYDAFLANQVRLDTLAQEMVELARRFEPRISNPELELQGRERDLWVRFLLTGSVADLPSRFVVMFHSVYRNVRVYYT
jgi:type VI secretion system protein